MKAVATVCLVCFLIAGCGKESKVEIPSAPVKVDTSKITVAGVGGDSTPPKAPEKKTGK
ncbi:MAG: hypothetical protein U0796_02050 [Gemmatales bacterium]